MKITREALAVAYRDPYYAVTTDAVEIRIWFLTRDIVRIRAGFDGDFRECSYSLTLTAWEDAADALMQEYRRRIAVSSSLLNEEEKAFVIQGERLKVVIEKKPFRICVYDADGSLLHADIADLAYQEDSNHRRIHVSQIEESDSFFGFGEKSGVFDKKEEFMVLCPQDSMGYNAAKTDSLYKHIPFYIRLNHVSRQAVGYFYHNTAVCDFDMGRSKSNYWHRHSRYRADNGDIDLFLIAGPEVSKVVERYTDLTGKSCLLPRQALGYLGSSMYYSELPKDCDREILNFVHTTHEEGFPIDGFQLSSGYCTAETPYGLKRCVFTWNRERFSDPSAFFRDMTAEGVVVSPNVKPGILTCHPDYDSMVKEGIFVKDSVKEEPAIGTWWGGYGSFVDFTDETARKWWKENLKTHLLDYGTASVWNDNSEYDSLVDKDARCHLEGLHDTIGHIKAAMVNIFCHITYDAIRESFDNTRPFIVSRSGHAGIQRYAQTWCGDNLTHWDTLKYNIPTILGMGLSGVANQGADIGGFYGPAPEEELFVRWVQNGIFQPRFSIHSVNTDNSVTEPWMYSGSKDLIRRAMELRYSLIPYYYALERRAHDTGLPILEPLFMEFQNDAKCYGEGFNFMVGPSLLVANVIDKGETFKEIYFPEGADFYDLKDATCYKGGTTVRYPVTMESIPMFLRSGGIVAFTDDKLTNLATQQETSLRLVMAPDVSSSFTLYEDDGRSLDFAKGVYLKTRIDVTAGTVTRLKFTHEGTYESSLKHVKLELIHKEKCPFHVFIDGKEVPHILNRRHFESAQTGWYYSQTRRQVEIKYPYIRADHEVTVSFEVFDMIGM